MKDVYISHASEDKEEIVRDLAKALTELGLKVWYDEFVLEIGDSLIDKIDNGLQNARYGIIVISENFLKKKWPSYEYKSLVMRIKGDHKLLLPIWHGVTIDIVKGYSLFLSNIVALNTSNHTIKEIGLKVLKVVRPDILENIKRYLLFRKMIEESELELTTLDSVKPQLKRQSKLSKNQIVRAKIIYFGIGQCFETTLIDSIHNYELDVQPEREIQSWEIMNATYLEFLSKNDLDDLNEKKRIVRYILNLSVGAVNFKTELSENVVRDLTEVYRENFYKY